MKLVFNSTTKTFSSQEYILEYAEIPYATIETVGGVNQADRVNNLGTDATLEDVITAFNSLLSKLINANIMVNKPI